jgi:hypothetical protein
MPANQKNKFNPFRDLFKSKEEKILIKIGKARKQIDELKTKVRFEQSYEKRRTMETEMDNLKEEIIKMGKYILKDGKLVKNDNTEQQEGTQMPENIERTPEPQPQPQPQQYQGEQVPQQFQGQVPQQQFQEQVPQQQFQEPGILQQQYPGPGIPQQQYQEEPIPPQYQREPIPQQYPGQFPQFQGQVPPQYQEQNNSDIGVTIKLVEGKSLSVKIPSSNAEDFINEISNAISTKTTMQINNTIINGRYIVYFSFGGEE